MTLLVGLMVQAMPPSIASAAQIGDNRSLTLVAGDFDGDGVYDGGSKPGGLVSHLFNFTIPTGADVGSIKFQYCTTAAAVPNGTGCNAPAGIDTTQVTLGSQSGAAGFSGMLKANEDDASDGIQNVVLLQRLSAQNIAAATQVSYQLDRVVNPSTAMTFFVRISTYATTDGTGSPIDTGTVAAATSTQIHLTGTMPESLVFCAGASVGLTNSVPDCGTVTTGDVAFDRLFSPTDTALATSQMAASTNASFGYAITVNGTTLTSGSNTITGMAANDQSKHGVSQFGMNLVANDGSAYTNAPNLSDMSAALEPNAADVSLASDGVNLNGRAYTGYDAAGTHDGTFKFNPGDVVADSGYSTGVPKGSDSQIFTVSYIANVPGNQPAGGYATTLTYICTPTF
ncbi:MAG TPA: hypothetical protein VFL85_04155 [Candidatus Saccharimonadales bacterium]|nr:hypothetical protein [Candidatus Saccharimonadales bacterium]